MKGLILDLRGNGGGYLVEAINIASQFIPKGEVITYRIDKYESKEISKSEGGVAIGLPLVISENIRRNGNEEENVERNNGRSDGSVYAGRLQCRKRNTGW